MFVARRAPPALSRSVGLALAVAAISGCGDIEPLEASEDPALLLEEGPPVLDLVGTGHAVERPRTLLGPPYPIILVHGFSGWNDIGPFEYFFGIRDLLTDEGHDVTTPALPPYNSSEVRARVLARAIDEVLERTGKAKVHLIGHSQGGVDCRRVVSHHGLGYADRVASVTTISTPHFGTAVADLAKQAPDGVLNPAGRFLGWLIGSLDGAPPSDADWAQEETSAAWSPDLSASIESLRPATMRDLVARKPMPPEVPFFTVAGVSNLRSLDHPHCAASIWGIPRRVDDVDPIFLPTGTYLSFTDGGTLFDTTPNDGLVTVESARAPEGTFLGCVPADHADEIGQVADFTPGLISGWDHRSFYRRLVANARSVE
jgi:triacylglycerol lipase